MTAKTTIPLVDQLNALGLRHTASNLDDLVAIATKRRFGPTETIELLVEREAQHRAKRSLERRLARSLRRSREWTRVCSREVTHRAPLIDEGAARDRRAEQAVFGMSSLVRPSSSAEGSAEDLRAA